MVNYGPRLIGQKLFSGFCARFGRESNLDVDSIREAQLRLHSDSKLIESEKYLSTLFEAYYKKTDPNMIVPAAQIGAASSFVPYYRGFTQVILYNFFSINYGIRDPILYRISILNDEHVAWCEQFILASGNTININDTNLKTDNLPKHGNLIIEAFHPRISTPMNQLRYFVIYHDSKSGALSGVHSLGAKLNGLPKLTQPSYRAYGFDNSKYYYHNIKSPRNLLSIDSTSKKTRLEKLHSNTSMIAHAYITCVSSGGCPTSVWHDGPTPHYTETISSYEKYGACYTVFYIPDFQRNAPFVFISSSQISYLPKTIKIKLVTEVGEYIADKDINISIDNTTINLTEEFNQNISGSCNVIFEFDRDLSEFPKPPSIYVHVYYKSPQGFGDQVHSHNSIGYYDTPAKDYKSYRCRKFAPYLKDKDIDFIYSIINLAPNGKPSHDKSIRIRIFNDMGTEFITYLDLNSSGVTNARANDILNKLPIKIKSSAIFQFEHETTNFNGSWYMIDKNNGALGVDHFSGG